MHLQVERTNSWDRNVIRSEAIV